MWAAVRIGRPPLHPLPSRARLLSTAYLDLGGKRLRLALPIGYWFCMCFENAWRWFVALHCKGWPNI